MKCTCDEVDESKVCFYHKEKIRVREEKACIELVNECVKFLGDESGHQPAALLLNSQKDKLVKKILDRPSGIQDAPSDGCCGYKE